MNRREFQRLAETRLADCEAMLAARRYSAAYYLAGYAVECALKACIAKRTRRHDFPPDARSVARMYTHNLESLMDAADLKIDASERARSDPAFAESWRIVKDWSEQSRYDTWSRADAIALVSAVGDESNGVLPWLKTLW